MKVLNDFNTSVEKALSEIDPKWRDYPGLIVCGTHSPHMVEYMIDEIQSARESNLPFLGICFGMQLMAIEYARNVMGIEDATSEEFGQGTLVVKKLPEMRVGMKDLETVSSACSTGQKVDILGKSMLGQQSHWHNYYVDMDILMQKKTSENHLTVLYVEENGLKIPELMYVLKEGVFEGVQFHPEYQSSKDRPSPLLVHFLEHAKRNLAV